MENNKENKIEDKNENPNFAERMAEASRSRIFKGVFVLIIALIIIAGAFGSGILVGYRKANFSYSWGENYHMNFGGPRGGFMRQAPMMFNNDDYIDASGVTGTIIKIDGDNLIIEGNNNTEKTVAVSSSTIIRLGRQDIKITDLKVGELTVTIGEPNSNGQINAKLIRVFNAQ